MMKHTNRGKILIAAALIGGTIVATSAMAGPTDEPAVKSFYIVHDKATNRCKVVDVKPTGEGVYAVAYESRGLANAALAEASVYELPNCGNPNAK